MEEEFSFNGNALFEDHGPSSLKAEVGQIFKKPEGNLESKLSNNHMTLESLKSVLRSQER